MDSIIQNQRRQQGQGRKAVQKIQPDRKIQMERRRQQQLKRQQKRRQQLFYLIVQGVVLFVAVMLFLNVKMQLGKVVDSLSEAGIMQGEAEAFQAETNHVQSSNEEIVLDYVNFCGLDEVEKPEKRNSVQVLEKLAELGKENETIEKISQNVRLYPENMLEALANNPEMSYFVEGYPDSDGSVTGGITAAEKSQEYPLFLQWDPRWGYASYGDGSNIGLAGCGPVSLSMVLYYLTGDETLTPDKIASYSMKNGYYMPGTGTAWALMRDVPALYGVTVRQPGIDDRIMKRELDEGHIIICAMGPGEFTAAGHFIVIYGYDENGFKVNDPNCVARSRKSWAFDKIKSQIKSLWSFTG